MISSINNQLTPALSSLDVYLINILDLSVKVASHRVLPIVGDIGVEIDFETARITS